MLLATQHIDEVANLLEHVVVIDRGRIVVDAAAEDLRGRAVTVSGRRGGHRPRRLRDDQADHGLTRWGRIAYDPNTPVAATRSKRFAATLARPLDVIRLGRAP